MSLAETQDTPRQLMSDLVMIDSIVRHDEQTQLAKMIGQQAAIHLAQILYGTKQ